MPLYSPDQLRIRHKLIPGVPLQSQIISLQEQLQQAEALGVALTPAQLEGANPLLGPKGRVQVPEKAHPSEFPDGYVAICAIVKDQGRDVREWLEYHRWLGVGKVYVYDNNSTVRGLGRQAGREASRERGRKEGREGREGARELGGKQAGRAGGRQEKRRWQPSLYRPCSINWYLRLSVSPLHFSFSCPPPHTHTACVMANSPAPTPHTHTHCLCDGQFYTHTLPP